MKMPIVYEGPRILKKLIEQEYARVSQNYERKNPRIVLGLPPNNSSWTLNERGFESYKAFCRFADIKISKFSELSKKLYKRKNKLKAANQANKIREDMRRIGFDLLRKEGTACYSPPIDAIILDAEKTALQFLTGDRDLGLDDKQRGIVYISSDLSHELVHNDLAECVPGQDLIESTKYLELITNQRLLFEKAAKKGAKAVERWREGQDAQKFLEIYKDFSSQEPEELKDLDQKLCEDFKNSFEKSDKIKDTTIDLGILVVDEALAYNYMRAKDLFTKWLKKESPKKYKEKGLKVYNLLEKKIESQGKLATLREVKKYINFSYENNEDCMDLFL